MIAQLDKLKGFYFRIDNSGYVDQSSISREFNTPLTDFFYNDENIGFFIGYPILKSECLWDTGAIIQIGQVLTDANIEDLIYSFSGSFIFVLQCKFSSKIYLDACGSLGVIYHPKTREVASSVRRMTSEAEYYDKLDSGRLKAFAVDRNGWIPGPITAHTGFFRLIANHCLDLKDFTANRHWPTEPLLTQKSEEILLDNIFFETRETLHSLLRFDNVIMGLTAGNECRLLLAALGSEKKNIDYFTLFNSTRDLDLSTAKLLAKKYELNHVPMNVGDCPTSGKKMWLETTGHSLTGQNLQAHHIIDQLPPAIFISGLGGEIARGFLWRNISRKKLQDPKSEIANQLSIPPSDVFQHIIDSWFKGLPNFLSEIDIFELAYIELRMSSWAFAQSYTNPKLIPISPLISRQVFTSMLSLPLSTRKKELFAEKIIRSNSIDLLNPPINRFGNFRDIRNLKGSLKSIRQRLPF